MSSRLLVVLGPFGHHHQLERPGQFDRGADDGPGPVVLLEGQDEGLVDLQLVDGQLQQLGHRRVADPEVVDGDADPALAQLVDAPLGPLGVATDAGLGDLQRQAAVGNVVDARGRRR